MKKLLKLTGKIVILGLIVLASSCTDQKPNDEVEKLKEKIKELEQTIAKLENCVVPGLEEPVDRVALSVDLKEFSQHYYQYFKMRKKMESVENGGATPLKELKQLFLTEGVWFDYNAFKEYIAFIDKNAEEADITISGLRFFPAISKEDGKMTLVYNPTIKKGDGNFSYALQKKGEDIRPVLLKDIIPGFIGRGQQQKGSLFSSLNAVQTTDDLQSQAGNRGNINPPPSDIIGENE